MTTIRPFRLASIVVLVAVIALFAGCGTARNASTTSATPTSTGSGASTLPVVQHVAVIMLENQSYSTVVGSASMPYLNSLMKQGALATNYYASTHPSLPNYFALTTGETLVTEDASPVQSVDNIVRELSSHGKTWKGYFQSLPSTGYMGLDVPPYVKHHNPFAYLSDVVNSSSQQQNVVNLTQLGVDAGANQLPNFLFIVPDDTDSAGDGCPGGASSCTNDQKLSVADSWLRSTVGTLMSSSSFQQSGVLLIVFDEAAFSDTTNGGGHIAVTIVGTRVRGGFQSSTFFQHPAVLRFAMQALGLSNFPGSSASAPQMIEFFQ